MNKIPRVLLVTHKMEKDSGSLFNFVVRQLPFLQKHGAVCKIFYLASRTSPLVLINEWVRFQKEIRMFKPDLIHPNYGTMTAFFCVIATTITIPIVVTYGGSDLNPRKDIKWQSFAVRILSQIAALRATKIICVSRKLKARLWWKRNYATVIPVGVDTKVFYPRPQNDARSNLGWCKKDRVVVFNAGGDPINKRPDLAQSAIDVASTICGEIRFVVLDGYVEPTLVPAILNAADCLLVTSDSEGSPTIVKEALSCNIPIVSVDVGDVRERLDGVQPSRIVKRCPQEIGSALAEILMKGDRSNGYDKRQEWSMDSTTIRILSVYKAAIEGK